MAAPSPTGGGRRPPLSAVGFRDQAATSRSPFPGVAAESYVYADPDASLGKSRRFTETLAKLLVSRTQTKVDDTTQHAHLHVQRLYALLRGQAVTVTASKILPPALTSVRFNIDDDYRQWQHGAIAAVAWVRQS